MKNYKAFYVIETHNYEIEIVHAISQCEKKNQQRM